MASTKNVRGNQTTCFGHLSEPESDVAGCLVQTCFELDTKKDFVCCEARVDRPRASFNDEPRWHYGRGVFVSRHLRMWHSSADDISLPQSVVRAILGLRWTAS